MAPWQDEISLMAPWQGERQPCSTRRAQLAEIQSSQTWQGGQTRTCCTSNYHQMLLQKIVLWSQQKPWKRCGHVQRLNYNFEAFGNIFPAVLRFENKNLFWDFFIPNCLICPTIPNWWGSLPSFNELTHSFTEWAAHLTPMYCTTAIYSSVFYLTAVFYLISILPHIYMCSTQQQCTVCFAKLKYAYALAGNWVSMKYSHIVTAYSCKAVLTRSNFTKTPVFFLKPLTILKSFILWLWLCMNSTMTAGFRL